MQERITAKQLAEITGFGEKVIQIWLCRSEFSKFYRNDNYFGRVKINYVFNQEFITLFSEYLKKKSYKHELEKLERYVSNG